MRRASSGFSLVELMVAITIGLLLLSAVVSVFVGSRTAYQSTSGLGALADGGRMALNLIGDSARSAGFLACNSAQSATNNTLLGTTIAENFALGTEGYEANGTSNVGGAFTLPANPVHGAGTGGWTGITGAALDPAIVGPTGLPVDGSDVLILRSSVQRMPPPQQAMAYTVADVIPGDSTLTVTPAPPAIVAGQYAVVSDCTKSVIFKATGIAGAQVTVGGGAGTLPVGFSAGALVSPVSTTVYYVGVSSDGASTSLWRLEQLNGPGFTAEELVPDIQNMQVLYGVDISGTQTAGAYVTADNVGTLNVVSIQVAVLAASPPGGNPVQAQTYNLLGTTITSPADTRMRHVFSATINLRDAVN